MFTHTSSSLHMFLFYQCFNTFIYGHGLYMFVGQGDSSPTSHQGSQTLELRLAVLDLAQGHSWSWMMKQFSQWLLIRVHDGQ